MSKNIKFSIIDACEELKSRYFLSLEESLEYFISLLDKMGYTSDNIDFITKSRDINLKLLYEDLEIPVVVISYKYYNIDNESMVIKKEKKLCEYMCENNLKYGIITNSFLLHFYMLDNNNNLCKINTSFLEDSVTESENKIKSVRTLSELALLNAFNWLRLCNMKYVVTILDVKNSLKLLLENVLLKSNSDFLSYLNKEIGYNLSNEFLFEILYGRVLKYSSNIIEEKNEIEHERLILNNRKRWSEELKLKDCEPIMFRICGKSKKIKFTTWLEFEKEVLNFLFRNDKQGYYYARDRFVNLRHFCIIPHYRYKESILDTYNQNAKFEVLASGDYFRSQLNKYNMCKYCIEALRYSKKIKDIKIKLYYDNGDIILID